MKLSSRTFEILKNCVGYNKSIEIQAGRKLRHVSNSGEVLIHADVTEDFPMDFAVAELGRLLNGLSLYEEPEIVFNDGHMIISKGQSNIRYRYSNKNAVISAPYDDDLDDILSLGDEIFSFNIKKEELVDFIKAGSMLELSDVYITTEGKSAKLSAVRRKDKDMTDIYDITCPITSGGASVCDVYLIFNNMKMIPIDYKVSIYENVVQFSSEKGQLQYFVAHDSGSKVKS